MLRLSAVGYAVGSTTILQSIDLHVGAGEIVSLIGPNGAGKSTVLKCVAGVYRASAGELVLDGRPLGSMRQAERARLVAYVPQHAPQATALNVIEMVGLGRAPHRGTGSADVDRAIVTGVAERLGLTPLAFRAFATLSGGERQRVLLARALAQQGRLLLLDEPTSALDLRHQLETMTVLQALAREDGVGVLVAIHDLALASRFSDRLVLMSDGRVQAAGGWQDVLSTANVASTYGVDAVVGTAQGIPYVVPTRLPADHDGRAPHE